MQDSLIEGVAAEAMALLGTGRQTATFTARFPGFGLPEAYRVAARLRDARVARGERVVGRKIGFTNRAIWASYSIAGPIWAPVYDTTVSDLSGAGGAFALIGLAEPRVEPEIVLHLASAPDAAMDDERLLGCIDWVAHGFEVVHSFFPGWAFAAPDAVAAHGVHGALLLGPRQEIAADRARWGRQLSACAVTLRGSDGAVRVGGGRDVLGGPLDALRFLLRELGKFPGSDPLRAGECITTGTLTEAMPALRGAEWTTAFTGIGLPGLRLRLA